MGLKLLTKLDAQLCLKLAWRAAQDRGYALTPIGEGIKRFTASKGNMLVGILGPLVSPHCKFEIAVEEYPDANELMLDMNAPWLTSGVGGVRRVRSQAEELLQAIVAAIEKEGGTIIERKEY